VAEQLKMIVCFTKHAQNTEVLADCGNWTALRNIQYMYIRPHQSQLILWRTTST